jgi:hypothetical protein
MNRIHVIPLGVKDINNSLVYRRYLVPWHTVGCDSQIHVLASPLVNLLQK